VSFTIVQRLHAQKLIKQRGAFSGTQLSRSLPQEAMKQPSRLRDILLPEIALGYIGDWKAQRI
jgi:hypothetical protein